MRILLVSQMYPGPAAPDFGVFVKQIADELEQQGHELERVVIDRRGGSPLKYVRLTADAVSAARRFRPEVVYAHFLVPRGRGRSRRSPCFRRPPCRHGPWKRRPQHRLDPGRRDPDADGARESDGVIAVSASCGGAETKLPSLDGRIDVIDCGVDLERFRDRPAAEARSAVGWDGEGPFTSLGTLDERKNPVRLAEAFERPEPAASPSWVTGRCATARRPRRRHGLGRVPQDDVPDWIAACDVLCQPSLSSRSARRCSKRSPPSARWSQLASGARRSSSRPRRHPRRLRQRRVHRSRAE